MEILLAVLVSSAFAADRDAPKPGAMAQRKAAAAPSAMAGRRAAPATVAYRPMGFTAKPAAPSFQSKAAVPAAAPDPEFGPRNTPPTGTPTPAHDLRRTHGYVFSPAEPPKVEKPLRSIRDEMLSLSEQDQALTNLRKATEAGAEVKFTNVTVLDPSNPNRNFGGASDPVLFLTGGAPAE